MVATNRTQVRPARRSVSLTEFYLPLKIPMNALRFSLALALAASAHAASAPDTPAPAADDAAYIQTTNDRAQKIVDKIAISDGAKAIHAREAIAQFYRDLHASQDARDARIAAAKDKPKDEREAETKAARAEADEKRAALHTKFLERLAHDLTPEQIDAVKDGLTYGVLPLTFRVYQEMLPKLTAEQKEQLHAWLVEAREHAMDGFTSEEKHAWFGKYKGRINNYLAKAGYNMKEAEKEMSERQKGGK